MQCEGEHRDAEQDRNEKCRHDNSLSIFDHIPKADSVSDGARFTVLGRQTSQTLRPSRNERSEIIVGSSNATIDSQAAPSLPRIALMISIADENLKKLKSLLFSSLLLYMPLMDRARTR